MLRPALFRAAALSALALGCTPGAEAIPEPPVPAGLEAFAPAAIKRINEALGRVAASPEQAGPWTELGKVYVSELQWGLAAECFSSAARLAPREPRLPYHEAVAHFQVGAVAQAVEAIENSIGLEPSHAGSHARLGSFHFSLGDMPRARAAYGRATELAPSAASGWLGLARVAIQLDEHQEAIAALRSLIAQLPAESSVRAALDAAGLPPRDGERLEEGPMLGILEGSSWDSSWDLELLALPPVTALPHAQALEGPARQRAMLAELEGLLSQEPDNQEALTLQARLLGELGDTAGAVEVLEHLCTLQPESGGLFAAWGIGLAQLQRHEQAVDAMRRAIELGSGDFTLLLTLGNSLLASKRWDEACSVYAEVVEERPELGDAWLQYAIAGIRAGRLSEAEQAIERAQGANASQDRIAFVRKKLAAVRLRRAQQAQDQ